MAGPGRSPFASKRCKRCDTGARQIHAHLSLSVMLSIMFMKRSLNASGEDMRPQEDLGLVVGHVWIGADPFAHNEVNHAGHRRPAWY